MLAPEWGDIDHDKGTVTINKNTIFIKGRRIVKEPKTAAGVRTLTVPTILLDMLREWHVKYLMDRIKGGANFQNTNLIIYNPENGQPFHPDTISQRFGRLLKKSGMRHIRLHDLRHINATMMLGMNISAKVAQKRLGHASYQITMDTYSHVLEDMENDASDKINDELLNLSIFRGNERGAK